MYDHFYGIAIVRAKTGYFSEYFYILRAFKTFSYVIATSFISDETT